MSRQEPETLFDIPGCVIELSREATAGKGEDAYGSYLHEDGCTLAVFDGCGGAGSQMYPCFSGKTGAYVAARRCREAYLRWYKRYLKSNTGYTFEKEDLEENLALVKKAFLQELSSCQRFAKENGDVPEDVGGTIMRPFPSTVSAILYDYYDHVFSLGFLWAGDSRGYVLDADGLVQFTVDDVHGNGDALRNLSNDESLSNLLSADGNFDLRGLYYKKENIQRKEDLQLILITATDGCFDYMPSPMHFEDMLLSTMQEATSYDEWRCLMDGILAQCSSDDYSIVLACLGFDSFAEMKNYFLKRQHDVRGKYILPLLEDYDREIDALWQEYKPHYYNRSSF